MLLAFCFLKHSNWPNSQCVFSLWGTRCHRNGVSWNTLATLWRLFHHFITLTVQTALLTYELLTWHKARKYLKVFRWYNYMISNFNNIRKLLANLHYNFIRSHNLSQATNWVAMETESSSSEGMWVVAVVTVRVEVKWVLSDELIVYKYHC